MRILHVIRSLDPKLGGPPAVVLGLATAQKRLGHDVRILTESTAGSNLPAVHPAERLEVLSASSLDESTGSPPDVDFIHIHGLWCRLTRRISAYARRRDLPHAIAPHGSLGTWSLTQKPIRKRVALALVYRRILQQADFVHVNNRDEYDAVRRVAPQSNIELLPHGLAPDELARAPGPEPFFVAFPELRDQKFILFLGRLAHQKAPDILVHAFAAAAERIPGVHLVIAGPDDGRRAEVDAAIARTSASTRARIHVLGPLFGADKYSAYQASSLFCLPSRYESFGLTIIEALSVGTPVVITETCHFPEVAEVSAGLVARLDVMSLTEALVRGSLDENFRTVAASRGRELVRDRYLWPVVAARSVDLYLEASNRRSVHVERR